MIPSKGFEVVVIGRLRVGMIRRTTWLFLQVEGPVLWVSLY